MKRLGTDYIDVYHLHAFDATSPVEETLNTLDTMVRQGKVRYIAASNFSGWHLMKSLSVSERYGWSRYVGHQVYYSLIGREYEWELMPLAADQGLGALVWSPLGWGRLTGKIRRGHPAPEVSRLNSTSVLEAGAATERRACVPGGGRAGRGGGGDGKDGAAGGAELAAATADGGNGDHWRTERDAAAGEPGGDGMEADAEAQVATLDAASRVDLAYPYWHQVQFEERNPFPVPQTY